MLFTCVSIECVVLKFVRKVRVSGGAGKVLIAIDSVTDLTQ